MEPSTVALLGGLLFLLIAIVGGGFTIREIIMPSVPGWARAASLIVGAALVVPYVAGALDDDSAPSPVPSSTPSAASSPTPNPAPGSQPAAVAPAGQVEIYSADDSDISGHGVEVSGLLASGERAEPTVGDRIHIQFSLRNANTRPLTFEETFIAARDPRDANKDFGHANAGAVLPPNGRLQISGSIIVDARGLWQFSPCYNLRRRGDDTFCPGEWRAFQVAVLG